MIESFGATHVNMFTWFRRRFLELGKSATHVDMFTWIRKPVPAFTLAEVLVTLGIIGVVAAMTLPTVIDNSRNKQLETALKRSYSVLSQALEMYYAEEGVKLTPKNCGVLKLKPILMKYLHTAKDCYLWDNATKTKRICVPDPNSLHAEQKAIGYIKYKTLNGTSDIGMYLLDDGQFVLNDSSLVLLENSGNMLIISVDVNGYNKRPNRLGIDLFMFQINNEGTLLPMGVKGTYLYSAPTDPYDIYCSWRAQSSMNGAGCTYKALYEKDYFKNLPR